MAGAVSFGGADHRSAFKGACFSYGGGWSYFCLCQQSLTRCPEMEQRRHRMGSRQLEILWSRKRHLKHLPLVLWRKEVDGIVWMRGWLGGQLHATNEASSLPTNRLLLRAERL